jgi:cytoskeletal protein RodZ
MAAEEERFFFGQYLQTARLAARVSLEKVAETTRISPAVLKAIEAEDFDRLPQPVFLKGFLRAYAQAVGADGEEAVRRYERSLSRRHLLKGGRPEGSPAAGRGGDGSGRRFAAALLLLAALAAATIWAYRAAERRAAPAPVEPAAAPGGGAARDPELPLEPAARARAAGPLRHVLTIQAREDGWVKVVADDAHPSEHALKAGDRLRLEAQGGFNLLLGNAGGLTLTLDGKPVAVPGKRGETVNIHLP